MDLFYIPAAELDAVSKSEITFVICVDDVVIWATMGLLVICESVCIGRFLLIDGRITSILSPWGRWIIVVVPLLMPKRREKIEGTGWKIYLRY